MSALLRRVGALLSRAGAHLWRVRAELLLSAAALLGWALVTAFVASVTSPKAWTLSLGLLALSLAGWRYLGTLAWFGLYALTRDERGARRG